MESTKEKENNKKLKNIEKIKKKNIDRIKKDTEKREEMKQMDIDRKEKKNLSLASVKALSKEERIDYIFNSMKCQIEENENNPVFNREDTGSYLFNKNSYVYHIELLHSSVTVNGEILTVEEFKQKVFEYINLCFEHYKIPTIVGVSVYLGISNQIFNNYLLNPSSKFHEIACYTNDIIHEITLQATISGKVPVALLQTIGANWGYQPKNNNNVMIVGDVSNSNKEKMDALQALQISQSNDTDN